MLVPVCSYYLKMSEPEEYCCFIGSLSWSTTDRGLKDAFQKFGHLVEAKVTFYYRYVDHLLPGGTVKIDHRWSIEGEKGKKKKMKRRKKKRRRRKNTPFPRAVLARSRFFSCVRRRNVSPRGEKDRGNIVVDKFSGRSRGFGFVTFDDKDAMEDAIEAMNGMDLDGRSITVERAQPQGPGSRDRDVGPVGTEMGEAVGVMEVIVIIVNALVHMNALVEAVVAIDLDPVAAS
ncbi:hypothetical protein BHM03_00003204, partial [Ensete ventricosum]